MLSSSIARPVSRLALTAAIIAVHASTAFAQQSPVPVYRPPTIALIVPADGAAIPADRPVVLFRLSAGDSSDVIDRSSVRMSVDGEDRTALLQFGGSEAWGALAPDSAGMPSAIAPGVHLLHVRACSMRGVCGMLGAPITVIPVDPAAPWGGPADTDSTSQQRQSSVSLIRMLLELVIALARKLIAP